MAKGSNSLSGRRSSSRNKKPYDANNSFVKKVATKVTDLIPQRSWISKWFNSSQGDEHALDDTENNEEIEPEEDIQKPPPLKRPCIRMDVTHPPGTFSIQPRVKASANKVTPCTEQYTIHNETTEELSEPTAAGPSGMCHLISSTPAISTDIRSIAPQRSDLNSLVAASNNGTTNGMDDNSESSESTSGCSSLIPQTNRQEAPSNVSYSSPFSNRKRFIDDKLTFTNHLQSPRSLFLDSNSRDSLSSRRPSFNASVMTNTLDRASPLSSPFYNGNITFGGANAAGLYKRGRSLFNNSNEVQLKVPKRTSVEVKPSTTAGVDSSGMSQTAKKILEALEHFSSPITDAKKIPLKIANNTTSSVNKKRAREETTSPVARVGLRHLTRELTVPTVPDILKLKRRQKLQDTTVAVRKIVSARNELPPPSPEYHLRTQADENSKRCGKLKAKIKTNLEKEETVEAVNLPSIPLPISSLPTFNFTPLHNTKTVDKNITKMQGTFTFASPIKVTNTAKNLKSINNFTFSSPINADDKQSANASSDACLPSNRTGIASNSATVTSIPPLTQNFMWSGSSTAPRPKEKTKTMDSFVPVTSSQLKSGSVMDVLCSKPDKTDSDVQGKLKMESGSGNNITNKKATAVASDINTTEKIGKVANLKDSQDTLAVWECSECLIKNNNSETQCFACKASKPSQKNNKASDSASSNASVTKGNECFGSQFKLSSAQWECKSCYVRNKETDMKCIACSALKASPKSETVSNLTKSESSNVLKKLTPLEESWECPGCMLKNSVNCSSCSCCNASKPNTLKVSPKRNKANENTNTSINQESTSTDVSRNVIAASTGAIDKFKPSKATWECPCCMVWNAASVDTCPCCNTAKPNSGNVSKSAQPLPTGGFGDKFKKPEGAWNCDSCMLQNESKVTECVACGALKPGSKKVESSAANATSNLQFTFGIPPNTGGFKFGIDKADQPQKSDNIAPVNGFKFGDSQQSSQTGQFTFGIQKEETKCETPKLENSTSLAAKPSGFVSQLNTNSEKTATEVSEKSEKKPVSTFSFGIPKSDGTSVGNEKLPASITALKQNTPGFSFGVPQSESKQVDENKEKEPPLLGSNIAEVSKSNTESTRPPTVTSANTLIPVTQNVSQELKPTSTFSFGTPSSTTTVRSSTSTSVVTTCLPSSNEPSFTFSESKPITQTATLPSFGQIATSTTSSGLSTFTFGENKMSETAPNSLNKSATTVPTASSGSSLFSNIPKNPPLFGNNDSTATPSFGTEESKPPTFGTNTSKPSAFVMPENKVPAFGTTENKPSLFGTSDTKIPVFGSTEKSTPVFNPTPQPPAAAPTPTFGAPSATTSLFRSTVTPVFGSNPPCSTFPPGSTTNIFSTTKSGETTTPNSTLFTFGTTPAQPVAQPGTGFNFSGNGSNTATTQKQLFTFGSTSNTPATSTLFSGNFNNPASNTSSGFTFNAPKPEAPAFGQPAVAAPIFGALQSNSQNQATSSFSSTSSSNAGFNFGTTAPATASGGFNFGGMPPNNAESEGFNFKSPNDAPNFDPYTRPSFNFTGGTVPPTFNATPRSSTPRKIKKAVRRIR